MGARWRTFQTYAIDRASTPSVLAAMGSIMGAFGLTPIPPADDPPIEQPEEFLRTLRMALAPGAPEVAR